jgi:formylglycine-generating enzyme required for sulfatase activity
MPFCDGWRRLRQFRVAAVLSFLACGISASSRAQQAPASGPQGRDIVAGASGIRLKWIPPGTFFMGDAFQRPVTTVSITRGYWLGEFDVTQGQWRALMGGAPSHFKDSGKNAPVESVSWGDAMAFCAIINESERSAGRLPAGYEYRLPTEAEWEYACRAGTIGDFGGDGIMDHMGWYGGNSGGRTHPVGLKMPNAWGLYDMHGNVWQWCYDWYDRYPGGTETDPTGPEHGSSKVYRGGCWFIVAEHCRSAFRFASLPILRDYYLGFRLALAPRIRASGG